MESNICLHCKEPFSDKNVFTPEGWAEIKISNVCEKCFDECTLISEDEEAKEAEGGSGD